MSHLEVRRAALGWVMANRDRFALPGALQRAAAFKPLGELAMTAELLAAHSEHAGEAAALAALAWEALDGGALLTRVAARAPALATLYPAFHRCGHRDTELERLLDNPAWLASVPRVPLQLPLEAARRSIGLPAFWDLDELLAETAVLPTHPEPGSLSDYLVYSMTHTVFHLTSNGRSPGALPDAELVYLRTSLDQWIDHYIEVGNGDLVGEMIMMARCIDCPAPLRAWSMLAELQGDDGSVAPVRGRRLPVRAYPERFLETYHPTLVAIMASALEQ